MFVYPESFPRESKLPAQLLGFLNQGRSIPQKPEDLKPTLSLEAFPKAFRELSETIHSNHFSSLQDADGQELGPLILKASENKAPTDHPTDTRCRPDYIAVHALYGHNTEHTSWPLTELVGEKRSQGDRDPLRKTLTYLHFFMNARPDSKVGLGILTSKEDIEFVTVINGIPSANYTAMPWGDEQLPAVMFAFIYRLYEPGSWVNEQYTRRVKRDPELAVSFDMKFKTGTDTVECSGFLPVFASNPLRTRTHVLVRPDSGDEFKGKCFRVVKDQLSKESRFTEREVYERIHRDGPVPGVAQPVFQFVIPEQKVDLYPEPEQATPQQDHPRRPDVLSRRQNTLRINRFLDLFAHARLRKPSQNILHDHHVRLVRIRTIESRSVHKYETIISGALRNVTQVNDRVLNVLGASAERPIFPDDQTGSERAQQSINELGNLR